MFMHVRVEALSGSNSGVRMKQVDIQDTSILRTPEFESFSASTRTCVNITHTRAGLHKLTKILKPQDAPRLRSHIITTNSSTTL
jgi:hypothetical protein